MDVFTLPRLMVWFFAIGGVSLIVVCIWAAQKAMTASKDRPHYKSQKFVKDYYSEEGKQVSHSSISGHLIKRGKENAQSWKDFLD